MASNSNKLIPVEKLELKYENNDLLEIDLTDFEFENAPPELQREITTQNDIFEKMTLIPTMARTIMQNACSCEEQAPRLARRWKRITKKGRSYESQHPLSQKDFDMYYWCMLVQATRGVDEKLLMLTRKCKCCGKMEVFKVDEPFIMQHIAEVYYRTYDQSGNPRKPSEYVMVNSETGEVAPADDLIRSMMGV